MTKTKFFAGFLLALVLAWTFTPLPAVAQRAYDDIVVSNTLIASFVWKSASASVPSNPPPGRLWVTYDATTQPELQVYDHVAGAWNEVPTKDDDETISGAWTFTGVVDIQATTQSLGNDEDDTITSEGLHLFQVRRLDFSAPISLLYRDRTNNDFTYGAADTEETQWHFETLNGDFTLHSRAEIGFAGTFTPTTFLGSDGFLIDDATLLDAADNDGIEFTFGAGPVLSYLFDEDTSGTTYCELSFTPGTIANFTDKDFYFGAFLQQAIDDTWAFESNDMHGGFMVQDNAGDLITFDDAADAGDVEIDTDVTLVDGTATVLRVVLTADTIAFYVDGAAVSTAATLNVSNGQLMTCRFGIRSSGTSSGTKINYIEYGIAQ